MQPVQSTRQSSNAAGTEYQARKRSNAEKQRIVSNAEAAKRQDERTKRQRGAVVIESPAESEAEVVIESPADQNQRAK